MNIKEALKGVMTMINETHMMPWICKIKLHIFGPKPSAMYNRCSAGVKRRNECNCANCEKAINRYWRKCL